MKRFIDNDTRYDQFLCPPPQPDTAISQYLSTCPYTGANLVSAADLAAAHPASALLRVRLPHGNPASEVDRSAGDSRY